jgi:hypothetical protein
MGGFEFAVRQDIHSAFQDKEHAIAPVPLFEHELAGKVMLEGEFAQQSAQRVIRKVLQELDLLEDSHAEV